MCASRNKIKMEHYFEIHTYRYQAIHIHRDNKLLNQLTGMLLQSVL